MPGKTRVTALAKELGVPAKELIDKLGELGEYVKSASSTIETPVARRLRELYPDAPPASKPPPIRSGPVLTDAADGPPRATLRERMNDPFDPLYIANKPAVRGPYKGDPPDGLKRALLDHYIVPRATWSRRPHGECKYWASEVAEAEGLVSEWADALFAGMTNDEVLRWIRVLSAASAEHAAALFAEGIEPEDLEWDIRFDVGRPTMQDRLVIGNMTVKEVVAEVRRRRAIRGA